MVLMGMKSPVILRQMTARGDRLDWSEVKDRLDLAAVATGLLGPAPGRRGGNGHLWWQCPFHDDKNPSFHVNPAKRTWKCYGCSEHGDAVALVMKLNKCSFPEAVAHLAGKSIPSDGSTRPRPPAGSKSVKAPECHAKRSSGLPLADALKLVEEAAARIWTPEGGDALAYLRGRGLTEATIKAARLGWTPRVSVPVKDGIRFWDVSGIVIPWMDRDRLAMVKIRRPSGSEPKYAEAFRDRPAIFPASEAVRPGMPLVVVEGEFDCLLLAQELADLAAVVTLGSASARPEGSTYVAMLPAPTWYLAHDADEAGDKAASAWPARARRVRPQKGKDWTDARQAGIELRRWWIENEFTEVFDREERAAVMEFDGGLSREAAERAACLIHSLRPRGMAESSN
jgi:DNA primase